MNTELITNWRTQSTEREFLFQKFFTSVHRDAIGSLLNGSPDEEKEIA